VRQERAQERRERILDAALDVFSERGYQDTVVDAIAGAAATSKGGVYFHFPGKQALFLALLDRSAARLEAKVERAMAGASDAVGRADAALRAVVDTFSEHRALARLLLVSSLGAGPEVNHALVEMRARFAAVVSRQLEAAAAAGEIPPLDVEVAGTAWFGAVHEVVTRWVLTDDRRPLAELYAALAPLLRRSVGLDAAP
jgi:TetR/AcrR family transcriptional regulator, fatty acid metabolism regulator protein